MFAQNLLCAYIFFLATSFEIQQLSKLLELYECNQKAAFELQLYLLRCMKTI